MLEIKNVSKSFNNKKVLDNCDLTIKDGSVFGLIGVNGAGKSTLLRLISGIYQNDKGEIYFNGKNTQKDETIRKDILFLSDDPYYSKTMTLKTLKSFYEEFYDFDEELYFKYLNKFNLEANKPLLNFSKGMRRQAFLIIAMAISPKLLILDEAFDGLDPLVRLEFKSLLINLINDKEITVIISSHNLRELEDICDSFGILEDGSIKNSGDIIDTKDMINKYQIAFKDNIDENLFKHFNIIRSTKNGRVYTLVIKGNKDEIINRLNSYHPLLIDVLNIDFEELFIYELESRGL